MQTTRMTDTQPARLGFTQAAPVGGVSWSLILIYSCILTLLMSHHAGGHLSAERLLPRLTLRLFLMQQMLTCDSLIWLLIN